MPDTALLVIDMQNALADEGYNVDATTHTVATILERARTARIPVIFMQHEEPQYPPMNHGADGWQIMPAVAPHADEPQLRKQAADSFYKTELLDTLRELGVQRLVVTGMQSDGCVDTTSRAALSHGFDVTLVADAHTTFDEQKMAEAFPEAADMLPAAQRIAFTNSALGMLGHPDHRITVVPSSEVTFGES